MAERLTVRWEDGRFVLDLPDQTGLDLIAHQVEDAVAHLARQGWRFVEIAGGGTETQLVFERD